MNLTPAHLPDMLKVFETLPDLYVLLTPDLLILTASNAYLEATVTTRNTIAGKYIFDVFPETSLHLQAEAVSMLKASFVQTLTTRKPHQLAIPPYTISHPEEKDMFIERHWTALNTPVLDEAGEVSYIIHKMGTITDRLVDQMNEQPGESLLEELNEQLRTLNAALIAARAQAELERSQWHHILMQAPAMICIFQGPEHVFKLVNPPYQQLVGQRPLLDKPIRHAMPELEGQPIFGLLDKVYHTGESFYAYEMKVQLDHDNTGKLGHNYYNFIYQAIRNLNGDIDGILVFAYEVTALVLARQKAEQDAKEKQLLNEQLTSTNEQLILTKKALEQLNAELEERVALRTGELRLAQAEAEEQRARLERLFMQAPAIICIHDGPDLVFELVSPAYQQLFPGRELLGKPLLEALPELEGQPLLDIIRQVYQTGQSYQGQEMLVPIAAYPGGPVEDRYWNFTYQARRDAEGRIDGLLVFSYDVTAQVLSHKAVVKQETYFRKMADQVPAMIWVTRADGYCTYLNKPWYAYTGQSEEEALGFGWLQATHPEDVSPSKETFFAANALKQPFSLLYRLKGKDGQYRWFLDKGEPTFDAACNFEGFIGSVVDVHEEQVAQQRLHLSVQAGKVGIWEWDIVRNQATYSDLLQEMFGLEAGRFTGEFDHAYQVFQQVIHPEDRPLVNGHVEKAFANRQAEFYVEFRIVRPTGEIAWIAERGEVIFDEKGPTRMNGTCIDITSRKLAEQATQRMSEEIAAANEELRAANEQIQATNEELAETNQQLVGINQDLDNFIYTASHDLKAPISNIEALLSALLRNLSAENFSSERVKHMLALMSESIERFKRTIANLTEVVKLQKENSGEKVLVDLLPVIREVSLDLEPLIKETNAHIEVEVTGCPPVRFSIKNLRSVIYNLLSNGLKYRSFDRAPHITISCKQEAAYLVLSVEDNGLGLERARLNQLFTMFKRFHDHVEGTGIGLYMVKKMVENAGGKIEVNSQLGLGSTFRVYFPH
ncbi:PAS domain-containing protein [Rhodocytophaga aerolata]|uniref:histidine kinase n=1 Tax=Rhodocytophaga aerolata TaxID=455078 RepID=A0ABT8RCQ5_9BACT|nr:PAS domain-containing protein [Rhodocytophaga aerolata]MDO1449486.1 PAS domain-containing protein [Rhodocytophaga aerolata]